MLRILILLAIAIACSARRAPRFNNLSRQRKTGGGFAPNGFMKPLFLSGGGLAGNGGDGGGIIGGTDGALSGDGSDSGPNSNDLSKTKQAFSLLFFAKLVEQYSNLCQTYPYPTKIITSAIVGGLGDILIQALESKKSGGKIKLDLRRILVFSTVTALYIAPVIHVWFGWINNLPYPVSWNENTKALGMMFVDQTIGATVITMGFFFAFEIAQRLYPPYTAERRTNPFQAGWDSVKNNLWITMIANWYCWPVINYVNFRYVPIEFRVLFANSCAIFWNMFLSGIANREIKKEDPPL